MSSPVSAERKNDANFDAVELLASENLINCYLREGGSFSLVDDSHIRLDLSRTESRVVACFSKRLRLGDIRLKHLAVLENEDVVRHKSPLLTASELADLLAQEIQADHQVHAERPSDWRVGFENSRHVGQLIRAHAGSAFSLAEIEDFIRSEQSLRIGHRFHPSPKGRIGFTDEDLRRYSPEFQASFQLHYFLLPMVHGYSVGDEEFLHFWKERVSSFAPVVNDDAFVLPVHPWQARQALATSQFREAVTSGQITDLGQRGPLFYPTASVRTVYQPEWDLFVKTSLDVRITNCFRPNLQPEMRSVSIINSLLENMNFDDDRFRIMREPLCLDVKSEFGVRLGAIFREGLGPAAKNQSGFSRPRVLLAASLFGDRDFSTSRLECLVTPSHLYSWFRAYCGILVPSLMTAFWRHGLMLEPHLQNVLVAFAGTEPCKILLRDLDNAKLVLGSPLAAAAESYAPDREMFYDPEIAWKRFSYCLFVNHLSEAVSSLAGVLKSQPTKQIENDLWEIVRDVVSACDLPAAALDQVLNGPHLWAKRNFFTRVVRGDDLSAPFAEVVNPLCHIS